MTEDQRPDADSVLSGQIIPLADRAADSIAATRLMLAMVDDDHATASRVLSKASAIPLLRGLLGWALAFGEHSAGGDKAKLRRFLLAQQTQAAGDAEQAAA